MGARERSIGPGVVPVAVVTCAGAAAAGAAVAVVTCGCGRGAWYCRGAGAVWVEEEEEDSAWYWRSCISISFRLSTHVSMVLSVGSLPDPIKCFLSLAAVPRLRATSLDGSS